MTADEVIAWFDPRLEELRDIIVRYAHLHEGLARFADETATDPSWRDDDQSDLELNMRASNLLGAFADYLTRLAGMLSPQMLREAQALTKPATLTPDNAPIVVAFVDEMSRLVEAFSLFQLRALSVLDVLDANRDR